MLESGSKYALYDLDTDTFIIPYQHDYKFISMNDKYIIVKRGENEMGVIDYSGNVAVPLKNRQLSFNKDGLISYYYRDGEAVHEGILNPENGEIKDGEIKEKGVGRCVNIRTRSNRLKIVFFCVVGLDIRQYVCALTP